MNFLSDWYLRPTTDITASLHWIWRGWTPSGLARWTKKEINVAGRSRQESLDACEMLATTISALNDHVSVREIVDHIEMKGVVDE